MSGAVLVVLIIDFYKRETESRGAVALIDR